MLKTRFFNLFGTDDRAPRSGDCVFWQMQTVSPDCRIVTMQELIDHAINRADNNKVGVVS